MFLLFLPFAYCDDACKQKKKKKKKPWLSAFLCAVFKIKINSMKIPRIISDSLSALINILSMRQQQLFQRYMIMPYDFIVTVFIVVLIILLPLPVSLSSSLPL